MENGEDLGFERRVEEQVRDMAPQLLGGHSAVFTEEDLEPAFPGVRNIDVGADFGSEAVLAEVAAGTVKLATREHADVTSFREDTERLVLGKPRQLYTTAANLLRDPKPDLGDPGVMRRHTAGPGTFVHSWPFQCRIRA